MAIVAPVFEVNLEDAAEAESVRKGIAGRLGALRSLVGLDAANPRPRLTRPRPRGSVEVPELGLVLALEAGAAERPAFVALVDLSLWPSDGRVRAPGARSKPGVASAPYVLNLCVEPSWRRRGLARKLMAVLERLVRDVWGDEEIYLHVEDEQGAANCLYENLNYVPMKYTYDKDFPYSKAEAKVLRTVTWRRKALPPPGEGSVARGASLPEAANDAAEVAEDVEDDDEDDKDDEDDEDDEDEDEEEEEEEDEKKDKEAAKPPAAPESDEDYSWVSSLMK